MEKNGVLLTCILLVISYTGGAQTTVSNDVDHAEIIRSLNAITLKKGEAIYNKSCITCHGAGGIAPNAQTRSFSKDKFHFGNRPYDMWRTVTKGSGQMAPQTWLTAPERYYVIQYIRDTYLKRHNPSQYFKVTDTYLDALPTPRGSASKRKAIAKSKALKGAQEYGQEYFQHTNGNYGNAIYGRLKDHTTGGLTVLLANGINLNYNLLRMSTAAIWKGDIDLSKTKYRLYWGQESPAMEGKEIDGLNTWQWTFNGQLDSLEKSTGVRTPLPAAFMDYHGNYIYGNDVILSYAIDGRDILELPQAVTLNGQIVLSQTLRVSGGPAQKIRVGHLANGVKKGYKAIANLLDPNTKKFIAVGIISPNAGIRYEVDGPGTILITIPASADNITLSVLRLSGYGEEALSSFNAYVEKKQLKNEIPDLKTKIQGSPSQPAQKILVSGELNANKAHFDPIYAGDKDKRTNPEKLVAIPPDYPYTVDNIGLPFDNKYNTWIRPATLGFKSDGRLVIGTLTGEVWIARGIDNKLENITWKRMATGLDECLGLKIINDQVYVTTHLGIFILRDLNGDDEADYYENFFPDQDISYFYHSFAFGLETDSKGNLYYTKTGEYTDNKDPGSVIKISPDGRKWERLATGFRVPNGITISPADKIFVSDNQGDWEPAGKIALIEKDGFYGYVQNLIADGWSPDGRKFTKDQLIQDRIISPELIKVPDTFSPPAIWVPQEFDNSCGGGVWSDKRWGPLGDQYIHTSYGSGWVYEFLPQTVEGVTQGAMVALPFQFKAGIQRAAVNPVDKQVYVIGLTGWDDPDASQYGILSRVRYKGGEGHLITGAEVIKGGIKLTFNFDLDELFNKEVGHYAIVDYNYKWSSNYGSDHYSIKQPGKVGEDTLPVEEATLSDNGRSLILHIPELTAAQTVRVRFEVKAKDRTVVKNSVYMTINKMPG